MTSERAPVVRRRGPVFSSVRVSLIRVVRQISSLGMVPGTDAVARA
jgi:hypothetical protein